LARCSWRDVAPDRRLGRAGQGAQIGHRDHGPFLHGRQDDSMAFGFQHGIPLLSRKLPLHSRIVNHFQSQKVILRLHMMRDYD
jgi:hypothetical protein